jgi:hypothetical protein
LHRVQLKQVETKKTYGKDNRFCDVFTRQTC